MYVFVGGMCMVSSGCSDEWWRVVVHGYPGDRNSLGV
jgi:hypothetical protein